MDYFRMGLLRAFRCLYVVERNVKGWMAVAFSWTSLTGLFYMKIHKMWRLIFRKELLLMRSFLHL